MEEQKFQSRAQLTALKVHAVLDKVIGFITYPFTWLADQCNATQAFVERPKPALKAVK